MSQVISLLQPDDWHLHLRDGIVMQSVLPFSSRQMHRAIIMPNLTPPVTTIKKALEYKKRILDALNNSEFEPFMTLYLTDNTPKEVVREAKEQGIVAFKLYPQGATTNSDYGVTDIFKLLPVLEEMQKLGILLLVHGEVADSEIDIFDREAVFIDRVFNPLRRLLPELKIVFEHITTSNAAELVSDGDEYVAATVTPQHMMLNRNAILAGGIKPHHYCLPILKRESHRQSIIKAVMGENSHKFFLGTDSAPHAKNKKECACGCAGIFSAHIALELYTEIFEQYGALEKLESFTSINGPQFYGLPINHQLINLVKQPQKIPDYFDFGEEKLIPFMAGQIVSWQYMGHDYKEN